MTRLFWFIFIMLASDAAWAQESNIPADAGKMWWAHLAVTIMGVLVAVRCAYQAFGRPPIQLAGAPTFPKYMTSPHQYRLGACVYVLFGAGFFLLLVFLHKEVVPVAKLLGEPLSKTIIDAVNTSSPPYLIIITVMGMIYLYLLTKEASWNVLLIMRDVIQRWISIPSLAFDMVAEVQCGLRVADDAAAQVASKWPSVSAQDFAKARGTIDRQWAEVCYMRWWINTKQASGSDVTFFAEKSFLFQDLITEFDKAAKIIDI